MRATPDFDFHLGEAAEMIRDTTARFADEQIAEDRADGAAIRAGGDADAGLVQTRLAA